MNTIALDSDITVYCIAATSFPEGVLQAHQRLHALVPFDPARDYFGIAIPDLQGKLAYKAASAELVAGELSTHNLEQFTISKGVYAYIDVPRFMQHIPSIGEAFNTLKSTPNLEASGVGIEWYLKDEVCRCLMKLNS